MIEAILNILKAIFGDNVLHRQFRIQTGLLLIIIIGTWWVSIWLYRLNWQWENMKQGNANIPLTVSNSLGNAILQLKPWMNTIEEGVMQSQSNEVILSGQIKDVQTSEQTNVRKIQRIEDYIEDSQGKRLDLNYNASNATVATFGQTNNSTP